MRHVCGAWASACRPPRYTRCCRPACGFTGRAAKTWTPFYPLVFRRLDLRGFHTVISSTSFAAHHVRVAPGARHIAYCHSPPRFLYGLTTEVDHARLRTRVPGMAALYRLLRRLDQQAAHDVTIFVANSEVVRQRIQDFYGRSAMVIYPPVDTQAFASTRPAAGSDYFLTWSRLVASKRIDVIIEAATRGRVPLVVAGEGPQERQLRAIAGPTVRFVGRPSRSMLLGLLERCRAVVFAAEEDFGIVPVEAMAAGKPVIVFGSGGARETVVQGLTGEWFASQSAEALLPVLRSLSRAVRSRPLPVARGGVRPAHLHGANEAACRDDTTGVRAAWPHRSGRSRGRVASSNRFE